MFVLGGVAWLHGSDSKKNISPSQDFLIGELRNQNASLQHEFGAHSFFMYDMYDMCDQKGLGLFDVYIYIGDV